MIDPQEVISIPFSFEYIRTISGDIESFDYRTEEENQVYIDSLQYSIDSTIENNLEYNVEDKSNRPLEDFSEGYNKGLQENLNLDLAKRLNESEDLLHKLKNSFKDYIVNAKTANTLFFNEDNFQNDLELITNYFNTENDD